MKLRLSLTQRFVLLMGLVIVALLAGSYMIQAAVMRDGLVDMFERRLHRSRVVVSQYAHVHRLTRIKELDAVLTSPRFLAAIGTHDAATIGEEAPVYANMLNAELFVVSDPEGRITFRMVDLDSLAFQRLSGFLLDASGSQSIRYLQADSELYEVIVADVNTDDGLRLGRLAVGTRFSSLLADDLQNLTGFDVVISDGGIVLGHTASDAVRWMIDGGYFDRSRLTPGGMRRLRDAAREIMYLPIETPSFGATVTFVGSPDDIIAPIEARITLYLLILAAGGGLAALAAIYTVTQRRVGRQVDLLVGAAEKIAIGDLDFRIAPQSHDELGYLAGEFETMRAALLNHRADLEQEHEARVRSERLAAIGRLATGIIHDFKNPMAIIRGNVDVIRMKQGADSQLARHYSNIQAQVDRMADLARDILEYSKGHIRLDLERVGLHEYFAAIESALRPTLDAAGATLVLDGRQDLCARLDPVRFRRVIDNLISNAAEMFDGGGRIEIAWRAEHDGLTVVVTDNGPGIPDSVRQTLFEPFATAGKPAGTGLGLSIARKIVEDHGGTIEVESGIDWGTRFTILLPGAAVTPSAEEATA